MITGNHATIVEFKTSDIKFVKNKRDLSPYFHWILFLSFFSMRPIPSRTFVISYIRLFWTWNERKPSNNRILQHDIKMDGNWTKVTSKVSAALLRSRIPSSACLIKLMNFLVKRPESESRNILPLLAWFFFVPQTIWNRVHNNYKLLFVSKANTEMHEQEILPRELS